MDVYIAYLLKFNHFEQISSDVKSNDYTIEHEVIKYVPSCNVLT